MENGDLVYSWGGQVSYEDREKDRALKLKELARMFNNRAVWEAQEIFNEYLLPRIKSLSRRLPDSSIENRIANVKNRLYLEIEENRRTFNDAMECVEQRKKELEEHAEQMQITEKSREKRVSTLMEAFPKLEQDTQDQKAYYSGLLLDKEAKINDMGYSHQKLTQQVNKLQAEREELNKQLEQQKTELEKLRKVRICVVFSLTLLMLLF